MHIALKSLIGLALLGGVGTGSTYAIKNLLATNEIADNLIANGYTILSENSNEWKNILQSYKTNSNNQLKFSTFTGNETKAEEELAKYCQKLLNPHTFENTKEANNYKKAEKWCVLPITVENILKKEKYIALSTDTKDNKLESNGNWVSKIKEHKKSNEKISDLQLESTENTATEGEIQKIKEKCSSIATKKNHEVNYEINLKNFKLWCSNKT